LIELDVDAAWAGRQIVEVPVDGESAIGGPQADLPSG
jgi:hypothetical protein